ncbi:peroxiredoxin [Conexibacter sp. S30A1]|uniref:peroxiredoxin family protein n=1 Tax=Conexibacter sp. S30A1 TaxID=2937800 RepID=UPI00200CDB98|nr:TlpA disulfide reductase family protein [Conexibacter sp. S30A1]
MRRFAVPSVVSAVVVALLVVLAFGVSNDGTTSALISQLHAGHHPIAPDSKMPLPLLGSSNGRKTLASLRGKVVMINFFAGWCDSCQAEAPQIRAAEAQLRARGGTVLGVTFQDSSPDAMSFLARYHLSFPTLRDPTGAFAQAYGVYQIPQTYIVGPKGDVQAETVVVTNGWLTKNLDLALARST